MSYDCTFYKVRTQVDEIEELRDIDREIESEVRVEPARKKAKFLSEKAARWRRRTPTSYINGKIGGSKTVVIQRRRELFLAALEIHGGTSGSSTPAQVGLVDTALKKSSKKYYLKHFQIVAK